MFTIAGPHKDKRDKQPCTLPLTPRDNLESPINLTCMFLDGGRKLEYPERIYAYTMRTCKLHKERSQLRIDLELSCCEVTVLTITSRAARFMQHLTANIQWSMFPQKIVSSVPTCIQDKSCISSPGCCPSEYPGIIRHVYVLGFGLVAPIFYHWVAKR